MDNNTLKIKNRRHMHYLVVFLMFFFFLSPAELAAKHKKKRKKHHTKVETHVPVVSAHVVSAPIVANWQEELTAKVQQANFPAWMIAQITEDLEPFRETGITKQDLEDTIQNFQTSTVVCHIKNGQFLYSPPIPDYDSRALRLVAGIKALSEAIWLPDMTFIVFTSEAFIEEENRAPVFTWCRHREKGKRAVNFPDYEALTGNYNFLQEVEWGVNLYPWESKKNSAFWRGTLTGGFGDPDWGKPHWDYMLLPRIKLAMMSKEFPELVDAKLIGQIGRRPDSRIRAKTLPYWVEGNFPISEHLQYKYQILADGYVCAFSRAYWQLFSNCLIFKQNSPWYQWYYRALQPYEHYIPYEADASDLAEKIVWAIQNDDIAHQIAINANDFAKNNLKHSDVMLYVYLLLNEYAKLQRD